MSLECSLLHGYSTLGYGGVGKRNSFLLPPSLALKLDYHAVTLLYSRTGVTGLGPKVGTRRSLEGTSFEGSTLYWTYIEVSQLSSQDKIRISWTSVIAHDFGTSNCIITSEILKVTFSMGITLPLTTSLDDRYLETLTCVFYAYPPRRRMIERYEDCFN